MRMQDGFGHFEFVLRHSSLSSKGWWAGIDFFFLVFLENLLRVGRLVLIISTKGFNLGEWQWVVKALHDSYPNDTKVF